MDRSIAVDIFLRRGPPVRLTLGAEASAAGEVAQARLTLDGQPAFDLKLIERHAVMAERGNNAT